MSIVTNPILKVAEMGMESISAIGISYIVIRSSYIVVESEVTS